MSIIFTESSISFCRRDPYVCVQLDLIIRYLLSASQACVFIGFPFLNKKRKLQYGQTNLNYANDE